MEGQTGDDSISSPHLAPSSQNVPDSDKTTQTSWGQNSCVAGMKRDAPRSSRVAAKRPDALAGLDLTDVDVVIAVCRRQKLFVRTEDHQKSGSGKNIN